MKKFLSIFSLTLATMVLMTFAIVPHHHHNDDVPCFGFEVCENHHSGCENGHNHKGCENCPTVDSYLVSEVSHTDHRCKVDGCGGGDLDIHFHAPVFIIGAMVDVPPIDDGISIKYDTYIPSASQSVVIGSSNLRAPPIA